MYEHKHDEWLAAYLAGENDEALVERLSRKMEQDPAFARESATLTLIDRLLPIALEAADSVRFSEQTMDRIRQSATAEMRQVIASPAVQRQATDAPPKAVQTDDRPSPSSSASATSLPPQVIARVPSDSSQDCAVDSRQDPSSNRVVIRKKQSARKLVAVRHAVGWTMRFVAMPLAGAALLILACHIYLRHALVQNLGVSVAALAENSTLQIQRQETWAPLAQGERLMPGVRIRTVGGQAELAYADGTRMKLGPETEATLNQPVPLIQQLRLDLPGKSMALQRGELALRVTAQNPDKPLRIMTAHAVTTVLGTQLALVENERLSRVSVTEGRVEVTRAADGKSVTLTKGQSARVAEDLPLFIEEAGRARENLQDLIDSGKAVRLVDFEKRLFFYSNKSKNSVIQARIQKDQTGANNVLRAQYEIGESGEPWDWVWFGANLPHVMDWSDYEGVAFLSRGSASGKKICLQIYASSSNDFNVEAGVDDDKEWHLHIFSWKAFGRSHHLQVRLMQHLDVLKRIQGFCVVLGNDQGSGVMEIDDICLIKRD